VVAHAAPSGTELAIAAGLGVVAGFASGLLTMLVYACEDVFQKLPLHWMWWPAIGAIFIGVGGVLEPRVLGVGYNTIHSLLRGELVGAVVIGLLVAKALVWSIALGSGTSGGVLALLAHHGGSARSFRRFVDSRGRHGPLGFDRHGGDDGWHDEVAADRDDFRRRIDAGL
jgi:H+/Cl- antiporter ClcA